ncbi:MAG TPA: hypothetical protein VGD81_01630 [Opitutaceae bacterium]
MGLTIHWSFHLPAEAKNAAPAEHDDSLMLFELPPVESEVPVASAEDALSALRSAALDLGFAGVSEMYRISREPERGTIAGWVWSGAQRSIFVAGERIEVAPIEILGFDVEPGEGCETACFWLARYPATVWVPGLRSRRVRTELSGWYSDDFCKTQYASNHGMENFLRSHVSLVRILDLARTMGFLTQVHDEGRYWTKRDQSDLANECEDWNRCLAAFFVSVARSAS